MASSTTNTTSSGFAFQSTNFGNNLIEIGAFTSLIGSTIAETLVFGDGGSAGLVWGTISTFGARSTIQACISGASPGWLRVLLGLRCKASDVAIGLDLELSRDSRGAMKARSTFNAPLGVSCNSKRIVETLSKNHHSCRDIYVFDRPTEHMLEGLPNTPPGDKLTVYAYASYPFFRARDTRFQLSALAFSLVKATEVYYMWTKGACLLALVSAAPYSYFFIAAAIVECREIILARKPADVGSIDYLVGALPTCKKTGGDKKLALGVSANPRRSIWWRLMWTIGALLYMGSLIATYFLLTQQDAPFILAWAGFQLAWLAFRILVSYLADPPEQMANRIMVPRSWEDLEASMKARVLGLTLAVAKYQTHVHPRNAYAYGDDSFSSPQVTSLLGDLNKLRTSYTLPSTFNPINSSTIEVDIVAVIGDTALSSASWMAGSTMTAMDLYDSCIVVFSLPTPAPLSGVPGAGHQTIAIPAARVLSGIPSDQGVVYADKENWMPMFVPRGDGSRYAGISRTWWYWIPCGGGRWLQIRSTNLTALGKRTAEVLGREQVTALLGAGNLNISLAHVKEVEDIVRLSQKATENLLYLLH